MAKKAASGTVKVPVKKALVKKALRDAGGMRSDASSMLKRRYGKK